MQANSMFRGSCMGWILETRHTIPFILSLNCLFIRAYKYGLTAELNSTAVLVMVSWTGPLLYDVKYIRTLSTVSVNQQIPYMALTATTINVTRFRTLRTPYVQRKVRIQRLFPRRTSKFIPLPWYTRDGRTPPPPPYVYPMVLKIFHRVV